MYVAFIVLAVLVVLGSVSLLLRKHAQTRRTRDLPPRRKFRVGQLWTYKTRPHETASRLTILRIERFGKANAIHVHVSDLSIQNPSSPTGISTFISHAPFAETALAGSVEQIVGKGKPPASFDQAYAAWRKKALAKRAGLFTIGVSEAIDGVERAFARSASVPGSSRFSD